jgi:hypothetical protein
MLVLSVEASAGPAAARTYAEAARQRFPGSVPIEGLPNLGLPGYRSPAGTVVFAKDAFTLTVDAARLPEPAGPGGASRASVA